MFHKSLSNFLTLSLLVLKTVKCLEGFEMMFRILFTITLLIFVGSAQPDSKTCSCEKKLARTDARPVLKVYPKLDVKPFQPGPEYVEPSLFSVKQLPPSTSSKGKNLKSGPFNFDYNLPTPPKLFS